MRRLALCRPTFFRSTSRASRVTRPAALKRVVYVADSLSQTRRLGELHHAVAAGVVPEDRQFAELGAVVAGKEQGRSSASDITLADLTGTGVQDTAIATLARDRAKASHAGAAFES